MIIIQFIRNLCGRNLVIIVLITYMSLLIFMVLYLNKTLPTSILVDSQSIEIVHEPMSEMALGKYEPFIHRMTINTNIIMDRNQKLEVIWHESMHAINKKVRILEILDNPNYNNYMKEEMIVSKLTPEIMKFVRDNNLKTQ